MYDGDNHKLGKASKLDQRKRKEFMWLYKNKLSSGEPKPNSKPNVNYADKNKIRLDIDKIYIPESDAEKPKN